MKGRPFLLAVLELTCCRGLLLRPAIRISLTGMAELRERRRAGGGSGHRTSSSDWVHLGALRVPPERRAGPLSSTHKAVAELGEQHEQERLDGERILEVPSTPSILDDGPSMVPFGLARGQTEEAVQIPLYFTVGETVDYLREVAKDDDRRKDLIHTHDFIYVTRNGALEGYITMASLLTNAPSTSVAFILRTPESVLTEGGSWEEAAHTLRKKNVLTAPIVSDEGQLLAVLNAEDLLKEMEIETTDDIMRQSGSGGGETYFGTPLVTLVTNRVSWLVTLLMLQSLSSVILTIYQAVIEKHIIIALFLTMITGTAGNAGNQSSAMVIRGLATGEIHRGNSWKCFWREAKAAFLASVILSLASFVRVMLTPGSILKDSVVICAATGATVVGAVLFGVVIPLALDRVGIDPVNFASPALATLTDVSGPAQLTLTFLLQLALIPNPVYTLAPPPSFR
ncbi:unnamed protein product [Chrysoparadoxa australica]